MPASGTPDGGPASVTYNFGLKTAFKIDNAGNPADSVGKKPASMARDPR